ncbi:YrrS family protein [Bacillus tropicus]|uniref:YrrS family protein n=1 Tax=Bacillus TaxID=1386 RepID=UPI000B445E08|nr:MULTISPECIES: YrrS family protein [Bacillus]MED3035489.1 YrrS family protein [Bacillus tropicus]OTX84351.1 FMN-dependent NADH-azoreductase [Bacillus thuringiensis serovar chanpaisis]PNK23557.1 FMN-dependent NADH-azoreductase [Bacillus thuringiensis]WBO89167.1 YrrS family protein [Bacillus tropicus]
MAGGSRFQQKQQKRRQNGVLNIAIAIVLILVAIVAYQLFVPDTKEQASSSDKKVAQQTTKENKSEKAKGKEETKKNEQEKAEAKKEEEEKLKAEEEQKKAEEEAKANEKVPAEKTQPKATDAYTKSSWKPVGTEQGATPDGKFQKGTANWNEMIKAISTAVEVPENQLVLHWVGRDKTGKSKAYGDVQDKQSGKRYYVNIDWVDNEGWKPVLVQTLN